MHTKNRQIKVARELQKVENQISQHRLDVTALEVRLEDQLNPILLNDRLIHMSSDLRRIPVDAVHLIPLTSEGGAVSSPIPGPRNAHSSLADIDTP